MLAMVDADYKFIYVKAGSQGRLGDSTVFKDSTLCEKLSLNALNLPDDCALPGESISNCPTKCLLSQMMLFLCKGIL